MLKTVLKHFSRQTHQEKIEFLKPIIQTDKPHFAFSPSFVYSTVPVLAGGCCALVFPSLGIFTEIVPNIVLYTTLYSSLHTTLLAGAHLGFSSAVYDDSLEDLDSRYLRKQLVYPFFAPVFTCFLTCAYWAFPFAHLKSLYTITALGFIYLGVFIGDNFFADRIKLVPLWYLNLKRTVTIMSLLGIISLALGVYLYPNETKLKTRC